MEQFDPYHRWLGISPREQPAHYYRLLGIELFESDPEVIRDAAERQMGHVRRYSLGKHSELSQQVLNVLGAAKACLLNSQQRTEYNARLRSELATQEFVPVRQPRRTARPPKGAQVLRNRLKLAGGLCCGVVLLCAVGLLFFRGGSASVAIKRPLKLEPIGNQVVQVGTSLVVRARVKNATSWKDRVEFRFHEYEPPGASVDPHSGEIRWPTSTPGTFLLSIGVLSLDGRHQYDDTAFSVEVRPDAPRLALLGDKSIDIGRELKYPVTVSNRNRCGSPLKYRLGPDSPHGARIDLQTGMFTWRPEADCVAGSYPICVEVTNSIELSDQAVFRVDVRAINHAPQLQIPDKVKVAAGRQQQIQLRASDLDAAGNRLTYSLVDSPEWVALEQASGTLICEPPESEIGKICVVRVRVVDDGVPPLADEETLTLLVEKGAESIDSMVEDGNAVFPRAKSSRTIALTPGGNRALALSEWDLADTAVAHLKQLRENSKSRVPGVFGRSAGGAKTPISELCSYSRGREMKLDGAVISLHNTVIPAEDANVNRRSVGLKRYTSVVNGRWHGPTGTWDAEGHKVYYGEYDKGQRQGFCCLFREDTPRLVLECSVGAVESVYIIANRSVKKHFEDEKLARADAEVAELLDAIVMIESELHKHDAALRIAIQKEFNLLQGQFTKAAQDNIQGRMNQRGAEQQKLIEALRRKGAGVE